MQKKSINFNASVDAWEFYMLNHPSIIDELFAGQLLNKVTCKKCSNVSKIYDPFLDLSLAILSGTSKNNVKV